MTTMNHEIINYPKMLSIRQVAATGILTENALRMWEKEKKLPSFTIRVYRGRDKDNKQLKPFTTTFKPEPTWSEKTAIKKANAYADIYEDECLSGKIRRI